jgi:hypothetical protein
MNGQCGCECFSKIFCFGETRYVSLSGILSVSVKVGTRLKRNVIESQELNQKKHLLRLGRKLEA